MAPPLPSLTEPAGISVLPVPTLALSKVWLKLAVSLPASVPVVMVGTAADAGGAVVALGSAAR